MTSRWCSINITLLIYTANCGHPRVQQSITKMIVNDPVGVIGDIQDMTPVMEGFVVSFSCHIEFILSGPNSSTCVKNGA